MMNQNNNPQEEDLQETTHVSEDNDYNEQAETSHEENQDALREQLQTLEQERETYLNGWRRAQADYKNLQKQMQEEKQEVIKHANEKLLNELIPAFDNFHMALTHIPEELQDNSWVQGISYVYQDMLNTLNEQGVEIINPLNQEFNPHEQEAVEFQEQEDSDTSHQMVTRVLQVGYKLNGKVIRTARVKVTA
jgi:molecular chaperone GrpE